MLQFSSGAREHVFGFLMFFFYSSPPVFSKLDQSPLMLCYCICALIFFFFFSKIFLLQWEQSIFLMTSAIQITFACLWTSSEPGELLYYEGTLWWSGFQRPKQLHCFKFVFNHYNCESCYESPRKHLKIISQSLFFRATFWITIGLFMSNLIYMSVFSAPFNFEILNSLILKLTKYPQDNIRSVDHVLLGC